jgi:hypothetical protein
MHPVFIFNNDPIKGRLELLGSHILRGIASMSQSIQLCQSSKIDDV